MTKTKTIYKLKWKNLFKLILYIAIIVFLVSTIKLFLKFKSDNDNTNKMLTMINEKVKITNVVDDDTTKIITQTENLSKFDSYWNYINLSMIEVDMPSLKQINNESIGWLQIKGTSINYPIVQHSDNNYYQNHSFDKKENSNGWIYLDYRNYSKEIDTNTIIYGNKNHMNLLFNNLDELFKSKWKSNEDNYIVKYCTNDFTALFQVFSIYKTSANKHLTLSFDDEVEYEKYLNDIKKLSEIDFHTNINNNDKIITITTTSGKEDIVMHAKLIKIKK